MFISTVNAKLQNRMQLSLTLTKSCHIKCNHRRKIFYKKQHTHPFNGPLSGTTRVSRYQKGKSSLDFTEATDSEWQWHQLSHVMCKSAPRSTQITMPAPHRSVFLQAGCPSCHPTKSVKALKAFINTRQI